MGEQQRDDDNGRRRRRYQVHRGVEYVQDALQLYRTIFHRKDSNGNDDEDEDGSTITSKYLDADTWTERARSGLLLLVTTTKRTKTETISSPTQGEHHHHDSSGDDDKEENTILPQQQELLPVGFCLSYPRPCNTTTNRREHQIDENNRDDSATPTTTAAAGGGAADYTWHIWLAGVLPEYRGQGIWTTMLLQETIQHASASAASTTNVAQQQQLIINHPSVFVDSLPVHVPVTIATIPKLYPNMYKSLLKEGFRILRDDSDEDEGQEEDADDDDQNKSWSSKKKKKIRIDERSTESTMFDEMDNKKIRLIRYHS